MTVRGWIAKKAWDISRKFAKASIGVQVLPNGRVKWIFDDRTATWPKQAGDLQSKKSVIKEIYNQDDETGQPVNFFLPNQPTNVDIQKGGEGFYKPDTVYSELLDESYHQGTLDERAKMQKGQFPVLLIAIMVIGFLAIGYMVFSQGGAIDKIGKQTSNTDGQIGGISQGVNAIKEQVVPATISTTPPPQEQKGK